MFENIDYSTVILSAIFAGVVATLVTIAIEKFGGTLGGVLGTIPTTIVPASYGIWISSTQTEFLESMSVIPLGMLINAVFLSVWVIGPKLIKNDGLIGGLSITLLSLLVWSICGIIIVKATEMGKSAGLTEITIGLSGLVLLAILGVSFTWKANPAPKGKNKPTLLVLASRGFMAAFAIGVAVLLSSLGYPLLSGLASVFPAIFLTTMVALWISQDSSVSIGAAGPMMLGGASVAVFALIAMIAYPAIGVIFGIIIAWIASILLWSVPTYFFLRKRKSVASEQFEKEILSNYQPGAAQKVS